MEKRVDRLKEEQTTLTAGSPWRLRLQGEALDADRLLALQQWAVRPAPDAPVLFSLEHLRVKSGDRIAIIGRNGCGNRHCCACCGRRISTPLNARRSSTRACASAITIRACNSCAMKTR